MQRRVLGALAGLITVPPTGDVVKLQDAKDEYRLRVGQWRVIFRRVKDERVVVVTAVRPRGGAYQD